MMRSNLPQGQNCKIEIADMKRFKAAASFRLVCAVLMVSLIGLFGASFLCGRYSSVSPADIPLVLLHTIFPDIPQTWTQADAAVILEFRFPRILAAVLVGASLAISGATYQVLFSNPVASPDTLGVSNGASFGAVIGILLGASTFGIKISAFVVGCLAILLVYALTSLLGKSKWNITYLLLVGMIISSVFSGLLSILKYAADPESQLPQITYWLMGSFGNVSRSDLGYVLLFFALGTIPLVLLRWRVNLLELDDSEARTIGVNIAGLRIVVIACATLLTASSTAVTGGISWVGLFIPHIARAIVGSDYRRVLPVSALLGLLFLLGMDDLARTISVNELPISILTSIVGAPIFFIIIAGKRREYQL